MRRKKGNAQGGFTLLEVILVITVAAILAAMFAEYMGTSLAQSGRPLARLGHRLDLEEVMEDMTADYKNLMATSATPPLEAFKARVESGHYGAYTVDQCAYITFTNAGAETAGGDQVLKVTISRGDQALTALFTR